MVDCDGRAALEEIFRKASQENRAVLLPYLTAGLPDPISSLELFVAMAEAGADGFEVGIPYSDPLMDGPTIHEAGLAALRSGTSLGGGLEIAGAVAKETGKPVIAMSYVNPVLRIGIEKFATRSAELGISAVILADLPVDESAPFQEAFDAAGLGTVLFVAPTTGMERLRAVVQAEPVFLYGIAEVGVTGEREEASQRVGDLAASVRSVTDIPLVLGVGISTPDHAARAAAVADGVIVGSALVRRVLDAPDVASATESLSSAVSDLAKAVRV